MKRLIPLVIVFSFYGCKTIKENNMNEESFGQEDVQFEGNQQLRKYAIELLDKVLKEEGDFGVYGDLSDGLETVVKDMNVKIVEEKDYYSVSIYPKKATGGHDFSFTIDKKREKRSDVIVGEVVPDPDFKD